MTPEQLQQLRDRITTGRQPVNSAAHTDPRGKPYAHPRGWNDALDFVERQLTEILGPSKP